MEKDIIDLYEFTDFYGNTKYVNQILLDSYITNQQQKLCNLINDISKNNPLNKVVEKVEDNDNFTIITDYFEPKKKFSLKRVLCTIGIAFGIAAAVKSAPKFHTTANNTISIESTNLDKSNYDINNDVSNNKKVIKQKQITLGDKIQLDDANLRYTSLGGKSVNTRNLDCDSYKINYVAVTCDNSVLDVIKVNKNNKKISINKLKDKYRAKYGKNIKFEINVDGIIDNKVIYKQAGWTSIKNISKKQKNNVKTYIKK